MTSFMLLAVVPVVIALVYGLHYRYFKVPHGLENLPAPPLLPSLLSLVTQPNLTRVRNYYFPLLHKYGLMRVSLKLTLTLTRFIRQTKLEFGFLYI